MTSSFIFWYNLNEILPSNFWRIWGSQHLHVRGAVNQPYSVHVHVVSGRLYSASQKKRNREVSMFYHNLITTIINEWYIFGKLRVSSFMWCYSDNAYFTHEWLKAIWRKETKKTFGGRYLNFEEKFTFLESWVSALSYDTSIRKNERGMTKFCLFKVVLAFP